MKNYTVSGRSATETFQAKNAAEAVDLFLDENYPDWNLLDTVSGPGGYSCSCPDWRTEAVFVQEA